MAYQIAQKVHACTDPHDPPAAVNDRARDVVDLHLLRDLADTTGEPAPGEVRAAIEDVFVARADEAVSTGATPRAWPTTVIAHAHWGASFARAAASADLAIPLADAVSQLNDWLGRIAEHPHRSGPIK